MKTKSSVTDKILKCKSLTLSDHTVVQEQRSDAALLFLLTSVAFFFSLKITGFNLNTLIQRSNQILKIFSQILNPKPNVLISILPAVLETLSMSVIGTLIGVLLAMPMAAVSSYNVNPHATLVSILRFMLSLLRSFPIIIVATICTLIFSLGSLSGTIAISVFTFSTVTKMLIESIETMDMRAFEALQSMGANKFRAFWSACIPEILSTYISHALYSFEINVRTAAILGYVGAGGIGIIISEKVAWRDYRALGTIIITLFVIVTILNMASRYFRKKYQSKTESNKNFINHNAIVEHNAIAEHDAIVEQYNRYPYHWGAHLFFAVILAIIMHYFYSISSQNLLNPKGAEIAKGIFHGIFHPDLNLLFGFSKTSVPFLMLETIAIAFAGTMIGSILALPVTFLSNERIVPKPISSMTTAVILFIRTIPTLVWALIWIRVTGPGAFCGVITLGICSIGMLSRLYSNAIDDLDENLIESLDAMGFTTFQKLRHGILPQLRANFISTSIYRFDINLRDATTLGIVGAGGIGATLVQALNTGRWSMAGSFIFGFVCLMMIIEYISTYVRKK